MTNKIEKRCAALINMAFMAAIIALIYLFFRYCLGAVAPFLLTFLFAVFLQHPLRWLDKKTKNKCHALWSILLVFLSICIVLIPVILLLSKFTREIINFIYYLVDQLNDMPTFLADLEADILKLLKFLPEAAYTSVSASINSFFGNLIEDFNLSKLGIDMSTVTSGLTSGISGVYSVVKNVPSALISIVISIVAWIFFTKDYRYIVNFIRAQLPDSKKNLLVEVKQVFSKTILKMMRAYAIILLITFCELFIGFSILSATGVMKNSYMLIIAIAIAVFDILPVAGSGGVLIPWALISLVNGNATQGIWLLVIYAVISIVRQYLEPKIVGDTLGVHPLVTLMGLYFGLKMFGFMGMFIVPISVMTIKAFNDTGRIHLYNTVKPVKRN